MTASTNGVDISFIVPAYNEEKGIGKCLEAIIQELGGNPNLEGEIIVVNNACTDNTKQVALTYPGVKVVDENQKGLVFARAAGATAASGELLAHIDADCLIPQGWLKTVMGEFATDTNLVALSGPHFYYDLYNQLNWFQKFLVKAYHSISYWVYLTNRYVLRIGSILQGGNFVVRKWAWERIGKADASISFYGEDTDLCQRLFKIGNVKFTPKLTVSASGRRLKKEGVATIGWRYVINYFSVLFFKKPVTKNYSDIRSS